MAIASRRGDTSKKIETAFVDRSATVVKVDNFIVNMKDYLVGQNYVIDYYSQTKGNADINIQQDEGSPTAQQHYTKIEGLRVKLKSPINTESIASLKGTLLMNKIQPQVNDVFKARLITGDVAVFRVNEVVAVNYSITTSYEVNFVLDTTDIIDEQRVKDLENSVTKTLVFNTNSIHSQSSAIITTSTMDLVTKLENFIYSSTKLYFRKFDKGIIAFGDKDLTYSPAVEELVRAFVDSPILQTIDSRSNDDSLLVETLSTTTRFVQTYFKTAKKNVGSNDYTIRMRMTIPSSVKNYIKESTTLTAGETIPTFNTWLYDGSAANPYFLYSPNSTSALSVLITKYLNNEEISNEEITTLITKTLTDEEEYYFSPILIMLVKYKLTMIYEN